MTALTVMGGGMRGINTLAQLANQCVSAVQTLARGDLC